jgi:hypothetical protein
MGKLLGETAGTGAAGKALSVAGKSITAATGATSNAIRGARNIERARRIAAAAERSARAGRAAGTGAVQSENTMRHLVQRVRRHPWDIVRNGLANGVQAMGNALATPFNQTGNMILHPFQTTGGGLRSSWGWGKDTAKSIWKPFSMGYNFVTNPALRQYAKANPRRVMWAPIRYAMNAGGNLMRPLDPLYRAQVGWGSLYNAGQGNWGDAAGSMGHMGAFGALGPLYAPVMGYELYDAFRNPDQYGDEEY